MLVSDAFLLFQALLEVEQRPHVGSVLQPDLERREVVRGAEGNGDKEEPVGVACDVAPLPHHAVANHRRCDV